MQTIETHKGPIDIGRRGAGPPVLFVHGTPGGADSSLAMGWFLAEAGFEVIAPSRPGYLGTPLAGREEIDQQAHLLAALLDALGHERAGIVSWSGGGPSGYRLSVLHPERVSALVPFATVSKTYLPPKANVSERLMEKTTFGNWLLRFMTAHAPRSTVSATLKAEGDLSKEQLKDLTAEVMDSEAERTVVLTMAEVVADYEHRKVGVENDLSQFAKIESLELERIVAPTLVVVGSADIDVPTEHSQHAASAISGAEMLVMDGGTHLSLFAHPDAVLCAGPGGGDAPLRTVWHGEESSPSGFRICDVPRGCFESVRRASQARRPVHRTRFRDVDSPDSCRRGPVVSVALCRIECSSDAVYTTPMPWPIRTIPKIRNRTDITVALF